VRLSRAGAGTARRRLLYVSLLLVSLVAGSRLSSAADGFDLIIRSGRVIDGTGNPAFLADVAIKNGRVAAIGRIPGDAAVRIDAGGCIVAPGFIDVHTHAENLTASPRAENFLRMGVTTIVTGNCGSSALDVGQFLRQVEEARPSLNVATLIGHNSVRSEAMGGSFDRAPDADELDRMKGLVDGAMRNGAVGLSTGLIYLPGTFSKTDEIVSLARVAAARGGIYASHMRNEGTQILSSLDEVFRISREAGIRAEVSHIKLGGRTAWGRADEVLGAIDRARSQGLDITQDQYVYTASSTGLGQLIPAAAREGGRARFVARIADPGEKAMITAQMKENLKRSGRDNYEYAVIASYPADPSLNGKNVVEAARLKRGADTLDDQIELILEIEKSGGGSGIFHGMSEEDVQRFLRHPNTMIASDSGVREPGNTVPHPRGCGNNARVLGRYVRELQVLRMEDAVRRMTSLPASTFRLVDRGLLLPGYRADIVVFDPVHVQDRATFAAPHRYPTGIPHVLVNGVPVVRDGEHTGARPGMALRHSESAPPQLVVR
jgi:N-acyl-D-amino-acid deacylase